MTMEQYHASGSHASDYRQLSQWQRWRDFLWSYRLGHGSLLPIFVLDPWQHPRRWAFGFLSFQTDTRFYLGPLCLLWEYE